MLDTPLPCHQAKCGLDVAANLRDHRKEICDAIGSIDQELVELLRQKGILNNKTEIEGVPQQNVVDFVLERVESHGDKAFSDLLWCLDQTGKSNIGHRYAAALLRNEYSLEMISEVLTSTVLQRRYQELEVRKMTRDLRVQTLSPYLIKNKLLTETEVEQLTQLTQRKGALKLLNMMQCKGPLAHLYLTMALVDAKDKNPLHKDILAKVLL